MSVETLSFDRLRAHIRVAGELDVATCQSLDATLRGHLAAGRRLLRLDMSTVEFVDAAALSVIAGVHHDALARRGTLVLVGVTSRVERVLGLVDLDKILFIGGPRSGHDVEVAKADPKPSNPLVFPALVVHSPARQHADQ